jgi:hypothetical protein
MSLDRSFSTGLFSTTAPHRTVGSRRLQRRTARLAVLLVPLALLALLCAAPALASSAGSQGLAAPPLALLAVQQAELTAGDGATSDYFGYSVAVSGDTALVGAYADDLAGGDQGSAYVFTRAGTTWSQQAQLTAGDGAAGDNFGFSVALAGDTALVGASGNDIGAAVNQGSAYVFTRTGTGWSQQAQLTAGDGAAFDCFGFSVAVSGDTALVGAYGNDIGAAADQGSAYVFTRTGTSWSQQAQLTAGDGAAGDVFGTSAALAGDTALIGAYADDIGPAVDQGSAYVFTRTGTSWSQQAQLTAGDGAAADIFGISVALAGDTALVGAYADDIGAVANQGSAYVFTRAGTSWSQQAQLTAGDGAAGDFFGSSVALTGDTALVGATSDDVGANSGQGSAYVFTRSGTTWGQQAQLTAGDGAAFDLFGTSVALAGDTALVGAYGNDIGAAPDRGSAYVFVLDATAPQTTASLAPPANAAGWNKLPVTVTLAATDAGSGVAATAYRPAGGAWTPYTAPFLVSAQGVSTFEYGSTDVAGHAEATETLSVRLDSKRPTATAYGASAIKGKKVKLTYKVSDALPGCQKAKATLKLYKGTKVKQVVKSGVRASNKKQSVNWLCTLAPGRYTLKVYATDIAGNAQRRVGTARVIVR